MHESIRNLLDKIQAQPGMYLGEKSLDQLITFVYGYIQCLKDQDGIQSEFLPYFQDFIEEYYKLDNNIYLFRNWTEIIQFFCFTQEEAFDKFYELLNDFKRKDI